MNLNNAQINLTDDLGGTEHVSMSLTRQFKENGISSRFIIPHTDKSDLIQQWGNAQGVFVDVSSSVPSNNERSWGDMLKFSQYIRSLRCPIVNLHYGQNHVPLKDVIAVRLAGVKKCYLTPHNAMPWEMLGERRKAMTRKSALLATKIIAITDQSYQLFIEAGIPKEKIETIYCGVRDVPLFDKITIREKYKIPQDSFVVMFAGRLATHKGVSDLIKACAALIDKCPNLFLYVVGDGADRESLEKEAAQVLDKRYLFTGRIVTSIGETYSAADVFVLPSQFEGLPLVYIEAALQQIPSIGTDVGGTCTLVKDGETGLLIRPGNIDQIVDSIYKMYSDNTYREKLGDAAYKHAKTGFIENIMFEKYRELYRSK